MPAWGALWFWIPNSQNDVPPEAQWYVTTAALQGAILPSSGRPSNPACEYIFSVD